LGESLAGAANLLLALRGHVLEYLVAGEHTLAHHRRRAVEFVKPIDQLFLLRLGQTIEAWLLAQGLGLLLGVEILVVLHPLRQVLARSLSRALLSARLSRVLLTGA
jgi:hypothetical protein